MPCRVYAPDGISHIICHEDAAAPIERDAHWAATRIAPGIQKAPQDIYGCAHWPPCFEAHENHTLAARGATVPRALLADEGSLGKGSRQAACRRDG